MGRLLGRWLARALPLVVVVSILTFVLANLVPGDAARSILGMDARPEQYLRLRLELGLDRPLPAQFWRWASRAIHGDLGHSILTADSIARQIRVRLPVTLALIGGGLLVAVLLGVGLGVLGALRRGPIGRTADTVALVGAAVPTYWLGLVLAYVVAVKWKWLPPTGYVPPSVSWVEWAKSLALPVLTLGIAGSAAIAKQTRDGVLAELGKSYVDALTARGVPRRTIVFKHVLRNAAAPIVTVAGLVVVGLLSGTVLVEKIFVLPGLGQFAVASVPGHDIPAIQAVTVVFTVIIVLVNLLIDLGYAVLDPRVR